MGQKWRFLGKSSKRGGAILTPNELVLTFGGLHLCVQFGENRQRIATWEWALTHTHTHRLRTDRCKLILLSDLSHAICYSYGTDDNTNLSYVRVLAHLMTNMHCPCSMFTTNAVFHLMPPVQCPLMIFQPFIFI